MKKILGIICLGFVLSSVQAQESLITDIMNVDAVGAAATEDYVKAEEEYASAMEKEKATLEKNLEKLGDSYKKDVERTIKDFQKILEGGVEKEVDNAKKIVQTQVNSMTIALRRDKKIAVNEFGVAMAKNIRDLPKKMMKDKEDELATTKEEYFGKFDQEYAGNQSSIDSFMSKQHVTDEVPVPSSTDGGE